MARGSSAGALKVVIEAAGLGLAAYRDEAPATVAVASAIASTPFCVVDESIANVPDGAEDGGPITTAETITVHLWQRWRDMTRTITEDYTLADALTKAIANGNPGSSAPKHIYGVKVLDVQRFLEPEVKILDPADTSSTPAQLGWGLVHHAFTIRVRRVL